MTVATRRWLMAAAALLSAYPLMLLGYVYWHTLTSGLPGGRHGPQDAYRHTLASALVAYTFSPRIVALISSVMESGGSADNLMDRHNNAIGAGIGARATSLFEINGRILKQVQNGRVDAVDPEQTTWLPPQKWGRLPI